MSERRICKKCKTVAIRPTDGNYANLICLWCGGTSFLIEGEIQEDRRSSRQLEKNEESKEEKRDKAVPEFSRHRYCSDCGSRDYDEKGLTCKTCKGTNFIRPSSAPKDLVATQRQDARFTKLGNLIAGLGVTVIFSVFIGILGLVLYLIVKLFDFLDFKIPVLSSLQNPLYFFIPFLVAIVALLNNSKR